MGNLFDRFDKTTLPIMNELGLTKKMAKSLLKMAKDTGLDVAKLTPDAPIIKMMLSGDPNALKHHVKLCKITKKEYRDDPTKWWPPEGSLSTLHIDALFNVLFKMSDCE